MLALLAVGALAVAGLAAWRAPEMVLRWHLARFTAADPAERLAAARAAGWILPYVPVSMAGEIVKALEDGATGVRRVANFSTLEARLNELRFYTVEHMVAMGPGIRVPRTTSRADDPRSTDVPWWPAYDDEELLSDLRSCLPPDFVGVSTFRGKVLCRAPTEIQARVEAFLSRALGGTELFNSVFEAQEPDRRWAGLLRAIAAHPDASAWLRGCSRRAMEGIGSEALSR